MTTYFTMADYQETVAAIQARTDIAPKIGMILGSGLGPLAEAVENVTYISYNDLPHWPVSTVEGHSGRLVIGQLAGHDVIVMQGRSHFYEGYTMQQVGLPVRVMKLLGVETMIITNAAGGVNQSFSVGDIMLIDDHINLPGMIGQNPLFGPNLSEFGPRFPSMTFAYDPDLKQLARDVAAELELGMQSGVYMALSGPTYETIAEIRFLQAVGADAVGMSTTHEVVTAVHAGMRVLGFSGVTNICNIGDGDVPNHEEVIEAGKVIAPNLMKLLQTLLPRL